MSRSHFFMLPQTIYRLRILLVAFAVVVSAGCELAIIPEGNGNDTMDMTSNGDSSEATPDDGSTGDSANSDDITTGSGARIQIELTAIASELDVLDELGIELDQTLTVGPTQAKLRSKVARGEKVQVASASTNLDNTIAVSGELVGGINVRQVLIGVKFIETTRLPIAFPIDGLENEAIKAFTTLPPGGIQFLQKDDYVEVPGLNDLDGGVLTDSTTTPDIESLRAALIDDVVKEAIDKLVGDEPTGTVLSAPQVTVFDQQRTTYLHRNELGEAGDLEDGFGDKLNEADPNVASVQSGFVLDLVPTVNNDGSISLTVYPGTSGIVFAKNQTAQVAGQQVFIELPIFELSTVQTTVSVPDGGTILLGGIKRLSEDSVERGVPILSKIPYVNRLFKNTGVIKDTQTLMLMVTPRIIIQEEEE
ncbi:MAG: hypothetical protein DHS20C16_05680 [Phycisphaerae bacterium]|nr:MAG: hypothetical protein DHS20C16_05680 [Phycisphaerae bacterium]